MSTWIAASAIERDALHRELDSLLAPRTSPSPQRPERWAEIAMTRVAEGVDLLAIVERWLASRPDRHAFSLAARVVIGLGRRDGSKCSRDTSIRDENEIITHSRPRGSWSVARA